MADAGDSNGSFLGSSTIQVRDSSPSGETTVTVGAILVPEDPVSFPQEEEEEEETGLDDDVQNLQLVGDNLVLMEGGVIVGEESGTILVQDSLYVQSDHGLDEHQEHVIAYLPESVPDQGQSHEPEGEDRSRIFGTVADGEAGMYDNSTSTVPTMDEQSDQVQDTVDDVAVPTRGPSAVDLVLEGMEPCYEPAESARNEEMEPRDQTLAQEVPEQMAAEQMEVSNHEVILTDGQSISLPESPDATARPLPEEVEPSPDEDQSMVEMAEDESSAVIPSVPEMLVPGVDGERAPDVEQQVGLASYEETVPGQDQELQVVPDSSAFGEPSKASVGENLHETMELMTEEAEGSAGMQMVPTSTENSRDTTATLQSPEEVVLQDDASGQMTETEPMEVGLDEDDSGAVDDDQVPGVSDLEIVEAEVVNLEPDLEEGTVLQVDDCHVEQQETFEDVEDAGLTSASDVTLQSVDISHLFDGGGADNVIRVLQNVDTVPSGEHSYELCVSMPQNHGMAASSAGGKTITVPVTVGNRVQEIPIQLPDWADLSQQNLVAVAEDGTTIPLTVIQTTDGEVTERSVPSDGKLLLTDEGAQDGIAFINMLQSQNSVLLSDGHEFQEGVIHLVQNADGTQTAIGGLPQYIYSNIQEHSILPDNPDDVAGVIHIPEDAYLSGQPIELQVVEVAANRTARARGTGARGATRGRGRRGTPSAVTVQPRPPRQPANRTSRGQNRVTASESKRAVRSIGMAQASFGKSAATSDELAEVFLSADGAPGKGDFRSASVGPPNDDWDGGSPSADERSPHVELSNTTPSVISPENMQTLIQILQTLPNTSRGQTIQIILQNNPPAETGPDTLVQSAVSSTTGPDGTPKQQYVQVVRMPPATAKVAKTTSDIAIQVSPEFIENAHAEVVASEMLSVEADETPAPTVDVDQNDDQPSVDVATAAADTGDEDDAQLTAAILMGMGIECVDAPARRRKQSKKKASKQIVTVEEQWVVDPKPGVSYYAVIDYLSEHDQDGFSSASEMKRPEAPSSGFMEDHLELHGAADDARGRSMLESTVDSSVIVSPFRRGKYRTPSAAAAAAQTGPVDCSIDLPASADQSSVTLQERTFEQAKLDEEASADQVPPEPKRQKRARAARGPTERYDHRCGYCEFGSRDKILVVEHCMSEHADEPVKTLSLLPQMGGRTCPYCRQSFDHSDFFSHMRFAHNEVHPYKCGYCDFMGRDRNQIRHHIQKKHRLPMKVINLLDPSRRPDEGGGGADPHGRRRIMALSEGEETVYEYLTDEEELDEQDSDTASSRRGLVCPECKKTFKTLKYLKTHIKIHQAHRYQCGYCDFISVMLHQVIRHCQRKHAELDPKVLTKELEPDKNPIVSRDIDTVVQKVFSLNTRLPRDPDASKWMRKWFCPHCDYTCQFGASYRRHLRMHANVLPFKCNYCSFKGREKYYVRRHIHRMHRDLPMIVVENTPENCAADTSSDEDFQEKGLRRKRRRRTKDSVHAVVPVGGMEDDDFGQQFQKLPVGERGMRTKRPDDAAVRPDDDEVAAPRKGRTVPRLPRAKEWSGENISDYIQEKDGDKIVCKMCGQKTLAKAFYKHARKHFKVKPFKCGYCNYMSIERAKIRVHNTLRHPNAPFKIEECHLASITPQDFMDLIGVDDPQRPEEDGDAAPPAVHFCCPLCQGTVDYDDKSLRDHFFAHYDYFPFKCSECDFRATSEDKVLEHSAVHDTPIIVYEIELEKPEGLDETIAQFVKEGRRLIDGGDADKQPAATSPIFQCPICDRQMNLHAVTVRRHLYSHYNYKPFKCGYCAFQGVSKANVKQHTVTHGAVRPKVELSDELMPDDLTKMLRHIQGVLRLTPETVDGFVDEALLGGGDRDDPMTAEGRMWKEALARGQCPWCGAEVGTVQSKLHAHLLAHFSPKPFQCGHCLQRFAKRSEVNQHIVRLHEGLELKVTEVTEDEPAVRKGLLHYLRHKRTSVGARSLVQNTTVDQTAAVMAAAKSIVQPQGSVADAILKEVNSEDGNEYQYQVVILSEDGTVVESMEVTAERAAAAGDDSDVVSQMQMETDPGGPDAVETDPGGLDAVEMAGPVKDEPAESDVKATDSEDVPPSPGVDEQVSLVAKTEAEDDAQMDGQPNGGSDEDTMDADIVTVEGVLLTRSFRSETEASDDDATVSNGSSLDSDEDDDEVLALGPSLEFVSDILALLKRSSLSTAQQKAAARLQANLDCQVCHRRFLKPSGLQTHMTRVHKTAPEGPCALEDQATPPPHSSEALQDEPAVEDQQEVDQDVAVEDQQEVDQDVAVEDQQEVDQDVAVEDQQEVDQDVAVEDQQEVDQDVAVEDQQEVDQDVAVEDQQEVDQEVGLLKRTAESPTDVHVPSKKAKLEQADAECGSEDAVAPSPPQGILVLDSYVADDEEEETVENITKMLQREGKEVGVQLVVDGSGQEGNLVLVQEVILGDIQGETLETVTKEIAIVSEKPAEAAPTPGAEMDPESVPVGPPSVDVASIPVESSIPTATSGEESPKTADVSEEAATRPATPIDAVPSAAPEDVLGSSPNVRAPSPTPILVAPDTKDAAKSKSDIPARSGRVARPRVPEPVNVGKYQLRGRGRSEENSSQPASKLKVQQASASGNPEPDTAQKTPETGPPKPEAPVPAGDASDTVLEGLENLEECDENLPKILQILQLRPRKENDKA